jgi:hypothetical protein
MPGSRHGDFSAEFLNLGLLEWKMRDFHAFSAIFTHSSKASFRHAQVKDCKVEKHKTNGESTLGTQLDR